MLAVALTPRRLVAYLQRNLDVRVPMLSELMSSFGETSAALEGQRGHILDANHHEEGLLPRTAATAGHPLLDPRHQRPSGFGLASLRPRASRWLRVQAFLPHLFAHRLLRVSAPSYWMSGLAHRPALQMKPAFVGFGSRRQHPVLIHSASSFLTKSNTQRTASRTLTTFFDYFIQISRHQLAKMRCGCRHITS